MWKGLGGNGREWEEMIWTGRELEREGVGGGLKQCEEVGWCEREWD